MYRVKRFFTDLQDKDHPYYAGDSFPRVGKDVTPERIEELASSRNKQGMPLIEFVPDMNELESPIDEPEEKPVETAEERPKRGRKKKG